MRPNVIRLDIARCDIAHDILCMVSLKERYTEWPFVIISSLNTTDFFAREAHASVQRHAARSRASNEKNVRLRRRAIAIYDRYITVH